MERNTGIVRRIDDLGRVVIPKEIRRKLNIHEGDPLEISYTDDGGVFFRKYLTDKERKKEWVNEMLFEKKEREDSRYTFSVKIIRNITILTMVSWISQNVYTSWAICSPQDEFDEKTGIAVAYAKMFDIEIPEYI
jgi:AbrB family looped-hinge helix DNA binding protein